jgi:hypothetical protein
MSNNNELILQKLGEKSLTKQRVWKTAQEVFQDFKDILLALTLELNKDIEDERVQLRFELKGELEVRLHFSGDTLIFLLNTNAYALPHQHEMRKSSYLKQDPLKAYFGTIHIYNFLSDSLSLGRMNDQGQLIGRLFVNLERHFFVEGHGQFSFLFKDIKHQSLDKSAIESIIQSAILYALDYDLSAIPLQQISELSVFQMENISNELRIRKSNKLGFKTKSTSQRKVL